MTTFSGLFGGSAGVGPYSVPHRGYKSGRYYTVSNVIEGSSLSAQSMVAARIYYIPFYIHSDISIASLTFANSAASSGHKLRVGIYSNDAGLPGTLLASGAEITLDASANTGREVSVPVSLVKGWYWFALQSDSATSILGASGGGDFGWSINGLNAPPGGSGAAAMQNTALSTYGALPSVAITPTLNFPTIICGIKVT